jgi:hypothetical protein
LNLQRAGARIKRHAHRTAWIKRTAPASNGTEATGGITVTTRPECSFVNRAVAVVIATVANLHRARVDGGVVVVAVHSPAAPSLWITVHVTINTLVDTSASSLVAAIVGAIYIVIACTNHARNAACASNGWITTLIAVAKHSVRADHVIGDKHARVGLFAAAIVRAACAVITHRSASQSAASKWLTSLGAVAKSTVITAGVLRFVHAATTGDVTALCGAVLPVVAARVTLH